MRLASAMLLLTPLSLAGQVRVNPTGVNVNTHGATTVFLTYGGITGHEPVEAFWCGSLLPAAPDRGNRCDPATLYGRLPLRYDRARMTGTSYTDIMSIPASVARRAYEAALNGETSSFFYVRRFRSSTGGPDEYVAVTCRLAGGGARVPFALTHVDLRFTVETPVMFVQPGATLPAFAATIQYNGTGRLRGRWEVVLPGEELPTAADLLTEATLPPFERGLQKRYTQIERFNIFVPPTGRVTLPGPDPSRLPSAVDGQYLILLRIEAGDDKEGDSNLAAVGAGEGVVHSGAVAGFPMPTLRYVVGAGDTELAATQSLRVLGLLLPGTGAALPADAALTLSWIEDATAAYYRIDLEDDAGVALWSAMVQRGIGAYTVPPFALDGVTGTVRWRVTALDAAGRETSRSDRRTLHIGA